MAARITPIFSGVAGQYFVAAELSRRSIVATVTLRNTRGIDILAASEDGNRTVGIQVKTNQGSHKKWLLNRKCQELRGKDMFYVLVNLHGENGQPTFHVVPADDVANAITESHAKWLGTPGRGGRSHKDNSIRVFSDVEERYLGAWTNLGLS